MKKIISLGLGVQSTALYYMSSLGELPRADMAIFADTGGEKTDTLEYLNYLLNWQKENNGIPIYVANYKNLKEDLKTSKMSLIPAFYKDKDGKNGMLRRRCTSNYKIKQITKKYREVLNLKNKRFPKTEIWIGISHEEKHRMNIPKEKWKVHLYPFCGYRVYPNGKTERIENAEIKTRSYINEYYISKNLPIPVKSSCVFCPFMSDYSWRELKLTDPEGFKIACETDELIRGYGNSFLHVSCTPLKDLKFSEKKKGFFDDLGNCSDYCNI